MLSVCSQVPEQQPSLTSRAFVNEENCACGTLGRLERSSRRKGRKNENGRWGGFKRSPEMRREKPRCSLITEILQPPLENCFNSEMKGLNPPLLLRSSCAQTDNRMVSVLVGFFKSNFVPKPPYTDVYLLSS